MNPIDDLDAQLTAALERRAASVALSPRGLGDVRRRAQRRRRRVATVGAAAVSVPALAGIAWAATRPTPTTPAAGAPDTVSSDGYGIAATTSLPSPAGVAWRCTGPLGGDGVVSWFESCEPVADPAVISGGPTTTTDVVLGTPTPITTIAAGWVGTILVVDATGEISEPGSGPAFQVQQSLIARGVPYVVEVRVADRTSPETMLMPVALDDDTSTNASVIASLLAIDGYDTWDASNWTTGAVPADLAMVIVLGEDWRNHPLDDLAPVMTSVPQTTLGPSTTLSCLDGTYTLVEGDTPSGVATKLDVSLDALLAANTGTPGFDAFQVGLEIVVPPAGC